MSIVPSEKREHPPSTVLIAYPRVMAVLAELGFDNLVLGCL